jgi:uncharacterized protein (TIGR03437 family)
VIAGGLWTLYGAGTLVFSQDGLTVYDTVNNVTWLADANLTATNRFGLPVCTAAGTEPCVNPSGSMTYQSAAAWVEAMNAANYLGHTNWQLPTTPPLDPVCGKKGPNGNSFGFGCAASAFGSLYSAGLGLKAPNTAVPVGANTVGPFNNLQPYLYWSQTSAGGDGYNSFSFDNGYVGANTAPNFLYVLPMIPGKIPGTPPSTGQGLQVNPGGDTVYDPVANVTWLANANLAATDTFGLPLCTDPISPATCVAKDGAMTWDSASQFIVNMNAYKGTGYLNQTNWKLPPVDPTCSGFGCKNAGNPMGELFYGQLGGNQGGGVVAAPHIAVGPLRNLRPNLYWSCQANQIQDACLADGPAPNFEWSFSFGSGFEGTDLLHNELYVTAYFVGTRAATSGPVIAAVASAGGESPTIAPNTWMEIKGGGLAPAGASRIWQDSDFVGSQMPIQLDQVSVTINGKNAYVYYISPTQINVLTPPDNMSGPVQVVVTNAGVSSASFTAKAQALSPSFFMSGGGPYVAATHSNGALLAPASLYPGATPAKPGEIVVLYANGFGPTSKPVAGGSIVQGGTLSPQPVIQIGGKTATVQFAGLVSPGEFQFNVVVPPGTPNGDQPITATYSGSVTQPGALIPVQN